MHLFRKVSEYQEHQCPLMSDTSLKCHQDPTFNWRGTRTDKLEDIFIIHFHLQVLKLRYINIFFFFFTSFKLSFLKYIYKYIYK